MATAVGEAVAATATMRATIIGEAIAAAAASATTRRPRAHKVWCAAHPVKCSDADMLALDETRGKQNHNHDDDDDDDDSTGGQTIATGTFEFRAHWRPTEISVPIATEYCNHTSVKLTVTNERGKSAYATLECN